MKMAEGSFDGRVFTLEDIVEKPSLEEAPSNIAVAGRYLLDPAVFSYLKDQRAGVGGEIQLTDAIRRMLAEKKVFGYVYPGKRHDIGNPQGYFKALEAMGENS
jgi:UTP--glucose-1-phosphate uridylyltransferase